MYFYMLVTLIIQYFEAEGSASKCWFARIFIWRDHLEVIWHVYM